MQTFPIVHYMKPKPLYLKIVVNSYFFFLYRPCCPRFRAQSFLLQGNMKTLCGYTTLLLKLQTMLGLL